MAGMWYFVLVLPLIYGRYVVLCACIASDIWQVCGTHLWYVADTSVDRHIAALLHKEKLPADND